MKKIIDNKVSEIENTEYSGVVGSLTYPESDERTIKVLKEVAQKLDDELHEEYLVLVEELQKLKNTDPRAMKICSRMLWIGDYFANEL